jgi:MFS family permease
MSAAPASGTARPRSLGSAIRRFADQPEFQQLSILILTAFVDMIGFSIVFPLMPFYAVKFKATPAMVGLLISSYSIAQLLFSPIWGRVSDRYGRRPALLIGLFASAMAYVVFGYADSLWLLLASRVIQGAGGGTTGVAQAYVSDTVQPSRRAEALGWLSAATALAVMIGPKIGSLAHKFGPAAPGLIAAGLCAVNIVFAWRWLPESRRQPTPGTMHRRPPVSAAIISVFSQPRSAVPRLIWIYGAGMLGFTAMTAVLALFLQREFGVTEETIGNFFFYVGLIGVVMRLILLGPIVRKVGEIGAMRIGTITLTIGLALYPFVTMVPPAWVTPAFLLVIPLVPIGTALLFPATTALMSRASDPREVGTTMGVAQTFAGVSRVVAPMIATAAFQRFSPGMPFFLAAGIVALVGILAFRLPTPMPERPTRAPG